MGVVKVPCTTCGSDCGQCGGGEKTSGGACGGSGELQGGKACECQRGEHDGEQ